METTNPTALQPPIIASTPPAPVFKKPPSEFGLYGRTLVFGLLVGGLFYTYTTWLKIPNALNKSVADAAIFLIGCSMILSSMCYFWDFLDHMIVYRKYLGLVGFAFSLTHMLLSFSALQALFKSETWAKGAMWPALAGSMAMIIFAIMALISNRLMALKLGGKVWRGILRAGYLAVALVGAHVVLLKYGRWVAWYQGGMKTWPSSSMVVAVWILVVLVMRIALLIALKTKKVANSTTTPSTNPSSVSQPLNNT